MKILFSHRYLGALGGAEGHIEIAARGLKERGHSVGLLYEERTGRNEKEWGLLFDQDFRINGRAQPEVQHAVEQFQPDIIYVHSAGRAGVLEGLLRSGIKVVQLVHDHSNYCLRSYRYNPLTRVVCNRPLSAYCVFPCMGCVGRGETGFRWVSYAERQRRMRLTRRCDSLLVYSQFMRDELVRNGCDSKRISMVQLIRKPKVAVNSSSFSDRNLLLFAGQIIRGKGVDILLQSLAKVRQRFECRLYGEGNHRKYCENLSRKLGLEGRVKFFGHASHDELAKNYMEASAFLVSSVWPEPFGMAGPEAMGYGLPVIAFDAGGIREWCRDGETGFLVPWMDTGEYAARTELLLGDKGLGRKLGANAQAFVERNYDFDRQLDRLEHLFGTLGNHGNETAIEARSLDNVR